MENTESIISSIVSKHGDDISITMYEDMIDGEYVFCSIQCDRTGPQGYGVSSSEKLALAKAYSEFIERKVCWDLFSVDGLRLSSNGFSAHPQRGLAEKNAKLELIERDVVFCSWFLRRSPMWFSELSNIPGIHCSTLKNFIALNLNGLECKIGIWGVSGDAFVTVALLSGSPFGYNLGFMLSSAADYTLASSIEKTLIEARSGANGILTRIKNNLPVCKDVSEIKSLDDHRDFWLNKDNLSRASWLFNSSELVFDFPQVGVKCEEIQPSFVPAMPRTVMRATSDELQDIFFGNTEYKLVNMRRISSLGGCFEDLNMEPHPLS